MIKILINEEEVVSSSNLQINEEMLSTSSTILKNCYPKTWEQDKDYVSRYYFPKDYSKCEIYNTERVVSGKNLLNIDSGYVLGYYNAQKQFIEDEYSCLFNQYIPLEEKKYCFSADWIMERMYFVFYNENKEIQSVWSPYNKRIVVENNAQDKYAYVRLGYKDGIDPISQQLNEDAMLMLEEGETRTAYEPYEESDLDTLIFCGVVKNTGNISLNPREPHYVDLQILDFKTMLSEGETLNYVINDKTILEAIQQVIDSIASYGFVLGNVNIQNPNDTINAYSTLDKTAYDVFQYIAEVSQSRWTTRMIDEDTVAIDFFDPLLKPIEKTIESTEQYYCENNIVDISFNYSTNDYRNKQIMTSDAVMGSIVQTENKLSDGYTKTFVLENKIGSFNSISINGVEQTVITKAQQELGYTGDFVYTPGDNIVTSFNIISAGRTIVFDYYPVVRGREIIVNPSEITRISTQTNRNGTISRYENRNDTTNSLELAKIGQSYIKYKGTAEITLKVITTKDLFNVGEIVKYDSLVNDLDTDYMVKEKTIDMYLNAGEVFFTYSLTSNFNSENAINYFDNQRAKLNGNLGEGETIIRDIDIENSVLIIFYDTNIQETTLVNPTELDFALDGVLI